MYCQMSISVPITAEEIPPEWSTQMKLMNMVPSSLAVLTMFFPFYLNIIGTEGCMCLHLVKMKKMKKVSHHL